MSCVKWESSRCGFSHDEQDKSGWWNELIGPNKAFDTNKYFIVSLNNLGGCHGSSGQAQSIRKPLNPSVKILLVTVKDWVKSQDLLRLHLGLDFWHAVAGGSLGGMQALQWAIDFEGHIKKVLSSLQRPNLVILLLTKLLGRQ